MMIYLNTHLIFIIGVSVFVTSFVFTFLMFQMSNNNDENDAGNDSTPKKKPSQRPRAKTEQVDIEPVPAFKAVNRVMVLPHRLSPSMAKQ